MAGKGASGTPLAIALSLLAAIVALPSAPARAEAERCPKMVAQAPRVPDWLAPAIFTAGRTEPAHFALAAAEPNTVTLTYVGHSTFLIETAGGVTVATDYNDSVRPDVVPRIATMNRAHSTHFSYAPDPGIEHVLKGWSEEDGKSAHYDLDVGDLWVGNLPTNIRNWEGGTTLNGNSIFVFRAADLCIAHLGHLHHLLTDDDVAALGRIDVVLAPVDGSYTLDVPGMKEVLEKLEAPLVIPMHYFNSGTLERFLSVLGTSYLIERNAGPTITLSRATLPLTPTVRVLPGH